MRKVAAGVSTGLSESDAQDHIPIIFRAQGAMIDITHDKGSRTCRDSSWKITLLTPEPLVDRTVPFVEVRDGVYNSTVKVNDGSKFYVNKFNSPMDR